MEPWNIESDFVCNPVRRKYWTEYSHIVVDSDIIQTMFPVVPLITHDYQLLDSISQWPDEVLSKESKLYV